MKNWAKKKLKRTDNFKFNGNLGRKEAGERGSNKDELLKLRAFSMFNNQKEGNLEMFSVVFRL